jgi:hypothetical protein
MQKSHLSLLIMGSILAILIVLFLLAFYFLHFECHAPQNASQILVQASNKMSVLSNNSKAD